MTRKLVASIAVGFTGVVFVVTGCGRSPQTIATPEGNFVVPGPAQIRGGPTSIAMTRVVTSSGTCESPGGGQRIQTERVRTTEGRTEIYATGIYGCNAGWIDAQSLVPVGTPDRQPNRL